MMNKEQLVSIFIDMFSAIKRLEEQGLTATVGLASQFYIVCVILDNDIPEEYREDADQFIRTYRLMEEEALS